MKEPTHRTWPAVTAAAVCLLLATWVVFWPVLRADFIYYDENDQLLRNSIVRSLAPANLVRIFSSLAITSYYPVRTLSFAVDHALWGLKPFGYHLSNLLIHSASTLATLLLLVRLQRRWPATAPGPAVPGAGWSLLGPAAGAGLFALHPLTVEPVAWVSGREELLMLLFALLCMHAHLSACGSPEGPPPGRRRAAGLHLLAALCCAAACMSNAMAAVIPMLAAARMVVDAGRVRPVRVLAATWYLWALGLGTIVLKKHTDLICDAGGRARGNLRMTAFERLLAPFRTYGHNVRKLLWPDDLCLLYESDLAGRVTDPRVLAGALALLLTAGLMVLIIRRGSRMTLYGMLWFGLGLLPSSQLLVHHIHNADRFLYLPLVGVGAVFGWLVQRLAAAAGRPRTALLGCLLLGGVLGWRSRDQVGIWRDGISVFSHCIELHPDEADAYMGRANAYVAMNRHHAAIADVSQVLETVTEVGGLYTIRGVAAMNAGDRDRALQDLDRALALSGDDADAFFNRGLIHLHAGRLEQAIRDFTDAIRIRPRHPASWSSRGQAFMFTGELDRAVDDFREALRLDPENLNVHNNLGMTLAEMGRYDQARVHLEKAERLKPDDPDVLYNLGRLHQVMGNIARAVDLLSRAVGIEPGMADGQLALGLALLESGRAAEAAGPLGEAVRLDPDNAEARQALARCREPAASAPQNP